MMMKIPIRRADQWKLKPKHSRQVEPNEYVQQIRENCRSVNSLTVVMPSHLSFRRTDQPPVYNSRGLYVESEMVQEQNEYLLNRDVIFRAPNGGDSQLYVQCGQPSQDSNVTSVYSEDACCNRYCNSDISMQPRTPNANSTYNLSNEESSGGITTTQESSTQSLTIDASEVDVERLLSRSDERTHSIQKTGSDESGTHEDNSRTLSHYYRRQIRG